MFRISQHQLDGLKRGNLVERVIDSIHEDFPQDALDRSNLELRGFIARQLDLGRHYGFRSDRDLAIFAFTGWLLGNGFDRNFPAIAECLSQSGMSAHEKADWIEAFTVTLFDKLDSGR